MFKSLRQILVATLIVAVACVAPVSARRQARAKAMPRAKHRRAARTVAPAPPVALIKTTAPDYLSGEANVTVRGNQNPIVRLGMAQNGVTIIEFPASDRFFAIHTGNSDLVTVEESPTKTKDHHMVLRAGSGFVVPPPARGARNTAKAPGPATSIITQMRSGMVITFLMYPVPQLSQQAHRCVISYHREEIVAARRTAGLAVNLGEVESPKAQPAELARANPTPTPTPNATLPVTPAPAPVVVEIERTSKRVQGNVAEPNVIARNALAEAIRDPKKFKRWTTPLHGLAVSAVSHDINERTRLVVVAVHNAKAEAVRIVPGHPEMFVETLNNKGKPLQVEQIKKLHTETTTTSSVVPAGATVYYALVYETPILGARQHLRVAIGQTNAADEPAAADLTATAR